ncbi:MAG: trypsin-like serine protease, partial [Verrucomicrobiota bacterium]|nr:trypsin-like serine protease [Verrucomicrobiota bacterium]
MTNRILAIFVGITFVVIVGGSSEAARRIGKLSDETWENHSAMAQNLQPFSDLLEYPDFSGVGALVSNDGVLGTASLVAPDVVITAAHVLKNSQSDPEPNPADWEFILYSDYQNSPSDLFFSVNRILIHPSWITRQNQKPPLGDGDSIGVDLALVFLSSKAIGVQPYSLPFANGEDLLGKIAFVSGFGSLINGSKPDGDEQNTKRMAGRHKID